MIGRYVRTSTRRKNSIVVAHPKHKLEKAFAGIEANATSARHTETKRTSSRAEWAPSSTKRAPFTALTLTATTTILSFLIFVVTLWVRIPIVFV